METKNAKEKNRKPELLHVIVKTFRRLYFCVGLFQLIFCVVFKVAQPVFLGKLILFFNKNTPVTKNEAYMYAGALILSTICSMILIHHSFLACQKIGMRVRVACCSLIYRKILRLSKSAQGQTAAGQVVNLLSNDVNRFDFVTMWLHFIWIMPIQTVVITYFIWEAVGWSALIGVLAIFLQTVPVQSYLSKLTSKLRLKIAVRTDERVRLMSEIISGIQVIKMYAWEKPFEKMVQIARRHEIKVVTSASYLRGLFLSTMVFSERTSLFITLLSYSLMGHHISADKVFAMAQFYNILQLSMAIFYPQAVQLAAETKVSIKRLENFLLLEEMESVYHGNSKRASINHAQDQKLGVTIKNGCAKWTPNSIVDTLTNISLQVKPGKFCAVIGPVGSGKSSLLQTVLGELPLSNGSVVVGGDVAYCSQEPWLFVGTVRQNILFGQPYNADRYKEVIQVCALKRDLELFPHGDKTVVGERGISLSGGQRARINLARAVYRSTDVYLLDDPLSAVDTHVGRHLFDKCISTFLANKTRILVTHQLQYLRDADLIVILNNGKIETQGTYKELVASQMDFARLLTGGDEEAENKGTLRKLSTQLSVQPLSEEDEDGSVDADENAELIAKGKMKTSVFLKYFQSGASFFTLILLVLILFVGQMASSGADFWVTYWTNQEELRRYYDDKAMQEDTLNSTDNLMQNVGLNTTFIDQPTEHSQFTEFPLSNFTDSNSLSSNFTTLLPFLSDKGEASLNSTIPKLLDTDTAIYIYTTFILGSVFITSIRSIFFFKVCMTASKILHDNMFRCILAATMRFFDTNPSGRVLNRFSKDMGAVDEQLPKAMLECIQVLLVMTGILTMVIIVNYWLLIPLVIMGFLFYKVRGIYVATAQDIKRLEGTTRSPVFSHVSASLNGLSTIRASEAQEMVCKEFDSHQDLHTSAWFLTLETSTAFGFWLDCISVAFTAVVSLSFLVLNIDTFGGNVGLAISQSLILNGMLQHGMRLTAEVVNQMTSVERVLEYTKIEKETDLETHPDQKPPTGWPANGKIQFDHMNLKYSSTDPPVLKDLNFTIQPAHKVGIVGRTGAGKSSLISALFRLARLEGNIIIDNIDTAKLGLPYLRSRLSIIPQEPVLFSATLRDNLDPFHDFPDDVLWRSLEDVELKESMSSLDLFVNEGGSNFSAGQRQLVCLARAIIRNSRILVLDEATANVDLKTDAFIQGTIRTKFKECTVLTIAHRLNTVMDSDRVLVMEAGIMVEFDHPHILLQNKEGHFYKMVKETGKAMAEQLHKAAEEVSCHANKIFFYCSEILQILFSL
ncbi:multidrug resistance-associated protein 4-like isoform X2 [Zootermopsis nevadensis]|nr:multidrug resistance-associated protein 4-like isoform X2 [Zootermopsis nevadensis]